MTKRQECPLCGAWTCEACGWKKYYVQAGELIRCPHCRTTDGTLVGVVHSSVYVAEEHRYLAEQRRRDVETPAILTSITTEQLHEIWDSAQLLGIDKLASKLAEFGIEVSDPAPSYIDELAADIREVDVLGDLGAGALVEALTERGWTKITEES